MLQLQTPLAEVPTALNGYALALSAGGSELTYSYDTSSDRTGIPALLKDLNDAGIVPKDLQTTQSSLEDIFVSLVKDEA